MPKFIVSYLDKDGFPCPLSKDGQIFLYSKHESAIKKKNEIECQLIDSLKSKRKIKVKVLGGLFTSEKEVDNIISLEKRFEIDRILSTINVTTVPFGMTSDKDLKDVI